MEAAAMIRSTILTLVLLLLICGNLTAASRHNSSDFIRASCKSTRYPTVCEQCLSGYAPAVRHSPRQLAHAALSVSASRALAASSFLSRLSASAKSPRSGSNGAVRDCLETLSDSVDRIRRSVKELNRMGRMGTARFSWHLSNVQTWVSAALTDESTCLDSLAEDARSTNVRGAIRKRIVEVAQVTSNALALVNRLQEQGRNRTELN